MQIITLPVEGMTCASCVNRITRFLDKVDGVEEANVNLATESATVRFDPARTDIEGLVAAVEAAGYTAVPASDAAAPATSADAAEPTYAERHLADLRRRVTVAGILTIPLLLGLAHMTIAPFLPSFLTDPWLQLALATPVQAYAAAPFYRGAFNALRHRTTDMNTLVAVGTSAAYGYSVAAIVAPAFFAVAGRSVGDAPPLYFDTAATIVTLILLGRFLEARARSHTSDAIRHLIGLTPRTARVVRAGVELDIPIEAVVAGDVVLVRASERTPVDGVVLDGRSAVDESMVTGESMPVLKGPEDEIIGGTLNGSGSFTYRATRVGADTVLARIVRLVQDAQGSRAPIQRLADRVTGIFVPIVIAVATLTFVVWFVAGAAPAFNLALLNTIAVLIIACPCALGLATPTSIITGTGKGAEHGILFRNAEALERLQAVTTVVLDKTGTLTEGKPRVTDVVLAPAPVSAAAGSGSGSASATAGLTERELLRFAAAAERGSEHPLGEAIVRHVGGEGIAATAATGFVATPGDGVSALVDGRSVHVGRAGFVGVEASMPLVAEAERLARLGRSPVFVSIDGRPAGLIAIADPLKEGSAAAVAELRRLGLTVTMLTGDGETTARAIAAEAGVEQVIADVRPAEKAARVRALQAAGAVVAMVGDGVNDAPALASADVGIAIGTGTDIAIESAGVTLMSGDLRGLVTAVALSRATMRNIRQNLFWAFAYNVALIPLAAGALYPFTGWLLDPIFAAGAMALSSVTVVSNALRLRDFRIPATRRTTPTTLREEFSR
ncbi:MAG: heavy metal translocating P-type ATPase [Chloroflexi bacterium]|nr:heavy metal translocating P-type ATPase [Chloroflexota bacterium]MBF6606918.1 heavy metal translocating P-type ATPase [Chloroflexota bacterium]